MLRQYQRGGQANINNKLDGNKLGALLRNQSGKPSRNKKLLGRKRSCSKDSTSSSGARYGSKGKNSANGKQDDVTLKNSPESKTTIIPHVPNGATYGVGASVLGVGSVAAGVAVLDKVFKRNVFHKIFYGATIGGLLDYIKKNLTFTVIKTQGAGNIPSKKLGALVLDLENGKKMYVVVYYDGRPYPLSPYGAMISSTPYIVKEVGDDSYGRMLLSIALHNLKVREGNASLIREGYIRGLKNSLICYLAALDLSGEFEGTIFSGQSWTGLLGSKYFDARLLDHIRSLVDSKDENEFSIYENQLKGPLL